MNILFRRLSYRKLATSIHILFMILASVSKHNSIFTHTRWGIVNGNKDTSHDETNNYFLDLAYSFV
jgi:hypothetical protein